jgi:hypothetical protein
MCGGYNFIQVSLEDDPQCEALVLIINKNEIMVAMSGDEYHNKIANRIEGFLEGLSFCDQEYTLKKIRIEGEFDEKIGDYKDYSSDIYSENFAIKDGNLFLNDLFICEVEE